MVALNFNANEHEPSSGERAIVPEGWYNAVIVKTEQKATKDENSGNSYLALTMVLRDISNGTEYPGIVNRLNLWNNNQEAVRIAKGDLSKLCHVIQTFDVQDSDMLLNKPFQIKVTLAKDNKGTVNGNNFPDYRYANGAEFKKGPGGAPQGSPQAQNPSQAGFGQAAQGGQPGGFANPNAGAAPPQGQPTQGGFGQQPQPGGFGQAPQGGQPPQQGFGGQPQPGQGFGGQPQGGQPPQGQGFGQPGQPGQPGGFAPPMQGQGGPGAAPQPGQPQQPWGNGQQPGQGFGQGQPTGQPGGFGGAPQPGQPGAFGQQPQGGFGQGQPQQGFGGQPGGPWGGPTG